MTEEQKESKTMETSLPTDKPTPPPLVWRTYPFMDNIKQGILVALFIVAVLVGVWFWTYDLFMVGLGTFILLGSLASYFLPTRFKLDAEGAEFRRFGRGFRRTWKEFRCFYADKNGIMLSTFDTPRRMDSFRGMNIRFNKNRDIVIAYVEKYLPRV